MTAKFVPQRTKTLFWKRHIKPTTRRQPRPCNNGAGPHEGPLLNTAVYNRFGAPWTGMGDCQCCGSTVHKSQMRRPAA